MNDTETNSICQNEKEDAMLKVDIIIVSYNAGEKLLNTVKSIMGQTYSNINIIIKDALSNDGSLKGIERDDRIKIVAQKDGGIYDGMNQAIDFATSDYVMYLNCGDYFYNEKVVEELVNRIIQDKQSAQIYYANTYIRSKGYVVNAPSMMTNYQLFKTTVCHQSTIYHKSVLENCKFNVVYKITADYNLYLTAVKTLGLTMRYLDIVIADYEGDGYSDNFANKKTILKERRVALKKNFGGKYYLYKLCMVVTLQSTKQWLGTQRWFGKLYNFIAKKRYSSNKQD